MELIGGIEKRNIHMVAYDSGWPDKFAAQAKEIAGAVGDAALRIEHIGSTSVPGLAAKPIIDILLVVADSAHESSYLPSLEAAGYQLRVREPEFYEHRMLRTPARDVHLHVFSLGSPEIDRYLLFRDRLRVNADARQVYEAVKQKLAAQSWPDMNAYADAKTEIVERIIAAASAAGSQHIDVRPETVQDKAAIQDVNRQAFGGHAEAGLVDALRAGGFVAVSFVAQWKDRVVGHVLFSRVAISTAAGTIDALSLAPMAVSPSHQRQGIGTKLLSAALEECRQRGHAIVLVLGHCAFYRRFGFSSELARALDSPFGGGEAWMALELVPGALRGTAGRVSYSPPFAAFGKSG